MAYQTNVFFRSVHARNVSGMTYVPTAWPDDEDDDDNVERGLD